MMGKGVQGTPDAMWQSASATQKTQVAQVYTTTKTRKHFERYPPQAKDRSTKEDEEHSIP